MQLLMCVMQPSWCHYKQWVLFHELLRYVLKQCLSWIAARQKYVCGFVPSYLLPNKRPNSLDPFLQPLIEDFKELFINGTIPIIIVILIS